MGDIKRANWWPEGRKRRGIEGWMDGVVNGPITNRWANQRVRFVDAFPVTYGKGLFGDALYRFRQLANDLVDGLDGGVGRLVCGEFYTHSSGQARRAGCTYTENDHGGVQTLEGSQV
eukprot:GHVT01060187.1.p1 GENE.GHVT01060187.1~~GHVT01060187.1.p1  ORF type:complete len:117 (-),score=3.00 GHVT01060187.1:341-691(-)